MQFLYSLELVSKTDFQIKNASKPLQVIFFPPWVYLTQILAGVKKLTLQHIHNGEKATKIQL